MNGVPEISVLDLPADAVLIDVREDDEWAAGHIEGALHLPMSEVPARLADLPEADPLYIVCRSGNRSGRAAAWLNGQGIDSVNVAGGMQAWAAAGKPMAADSGSPTVI
ncbi:rhodanese-like domain-containing protein [Angustibacter sp. McL0619]|uniref:rhodanese-like domain-containing protein n=1 Tax=Angustibacter sp. McL0619 TaxID=3415676 RepID=UPI003CF73E78